MTTYHGHNKWLNKNNGETWEQYNKRIGDWEAKEVEKQIHMINSLKVLEQELKSRLGEYTTIKDDPDNDLFVRGVEIGLQYALKTVECHISARECVKDEPTKYELKLKYNDDITSYTVVERS